ncbi:MAG: hypothetical protein NVV59_07895 [Chitinophagaceae bacterium]|nr:hypothetical protein [Chitinophagaceae bacterium]
MSLNYKPHSIEKVILTVVGLLLAVGFYFYFTNIRQYEEYVKEDGVVEWITVAGLLMGSIICFYRFFKLLKLRSAWFLFVTFFVAAFLFFAAGEEISWGQRIFGIESSEFFQKNNAQGETNLHNLVVGGKKINKIIFSIGLVAVLAIYLLVFPLLYRYSRGFQKFADQSAIPIPRFYHVVCISTVFLLTELMRHGKRAEILEAGEALLILMILAFPLNKWIFEKKKLEESK